MEAINVLTMEAIKLSAEHIRQLTEWYGPDHDKWPVKEICLYDQEVKDADGKLLGHTLGLKKLNREEKQILAYYREMAIANEALEKAQGICKQIELERELERRNPMAEEEKPPQPQPPPPPSNGD